ncbi:hypothetical protein HYPSUDRAFT_67186 [Hypholoma sublateritium FD-334 SS-4]|uniref:NACHT domain-containing protein n=1 Tax=Hypholoma sublateritium (strain FD-334 SS-4) TaxID=945553 RepID=A0A0D2PQB3_HYPSF|nr:hypothetical protein HYPSUDRAFT_67186 [Hypholoma sublateritium FD-334 SS-4]
MSKFTPLKSLVLSLGLRRKSPLPGSGQQEITSTHGDLHRPAFHRINNVQRDWDMKRLAISFTLSECKELKDIFILVTELSKILCKRSSNSDNITQFMELCGPFVLQLSEIYTIETSTAVTIEFLKLLQELRTLLEPHGSQEVCREREHAVEMLVPVISDKISEIKILHNMSFEDTKQKSGHLKSGIDIALDSSITILDIVRDLSELIPPAFVKPAVGLAYALLKAVKRTSTNYGDMRDLSEIISEFVLSMAVFFSENNINISHTLESALKEFNSTLQDIVNNCLLLADKSLMARFLQQGNDTDTLRDLRNRLDQAIREFQLKTQILQHSDFLSFTKFIANKLDGDLVQNLPENPFYEGSRGDFIPEIQSDTLQGVGSWIEDSSSPMFLLFGGAGLGKSSISHQLVYHLMDTGRLASQVFFTRNNPMQNNPVTVIQTLAHELASMHPRTIPQIASAVRLGGSSHQPLSAYLTRYILEPIKSLSLCHPLVIVLDAMDECANYQLLLQAFYETCNDSNILKIFITSRPGHTIDDCITPFPTITKFNLKRLSQENMERFIEVRLSKIEWSGPHPTAGDIAHLAKLADGLLIWAATSCNFIGNEMQEDDPNRLLQKIISCSGKARDMESDDQMALLYHTTLMHLFGKRHIQSFIQIFQIMLVVQETMTIQEFATTFDLGVRQTRAVHSALCALEIYDTFDRDTIIPAARRFHASFLDYITQSPDKMGQSTSFYIDPSLAHCTVAGRCLSQMQRFYQQLPDIPKAISYEDLSKPVQYAVSQWPSHLVYSVRIQTPTSLENTSLERMAGEGIDVWSPLCILKSGELAISLEGQRFHQIVDEAVEFYSNSLRIFEAAGVNSIDCSSDFGFALWIRFLQGGSLEDMERSIEMQSSFLARSSHSDPSIQRAKALSRLGVSLYGRYTSQNAAADDLDDAISTLKAALEQYATLSQESFVTLLTLAPAVLARFEKTGLDKDLEEAVKLHKVLVEMKPPNHVDPTKALNNMAVCLIRCFDTKNTPSDLDEAISILYSILERRPVGHPYRSSTLNNLAFSLQRRFETLGRVSDLNDAISMNYEVLEARPRPHQYRAQSLTNTAVCLRYRFESQGAMSDLDEAISMGREAVELRPPPHPHRLLSLDRLAKDLHIRFQHSKNAADLDTAVSALREAVDSCPDPYQDYFLYLSDLGNILRTRFESTSDTRALDEAVEMLRKAYSLSPPSGLKHSYVVGDLGFALLTHYEHYKSEDILVEAIQLLRSAAVLRPGSHPHRFQSLNNLAKSLQCMFRITGKTECLEEVRRLYGESVQLCPPPHPSRYIAVEGLAQLATNDSEASIPLPALI